MKCCVLAVLLVAVSAQFDEYQGRYVTPGPIVNRGSEADAQTLEYLNDIYPDGSYRYAFNTDNGIRAEAQGTPTAIKNNPSEAAVVSQGSFSWVSPNGEPVAIAYVADENGYRAVGDAIPTPPPIPLAIQKSLEYNARFAPQQKQ